MTLHPFDTAVQQYTDTELVTAVLSGQTALFEILIRRYNPYLYKIGRTQGFNHHDTEDLMQETFINSYVNLKQFAGRSSFKTWLIRILLNQCYHHAHKSSFQKEQSMELTPGHSADTFIEQQDRTNSKAVISRELNRIVETCIQKLPLAYRTTFTLRELTGLSIAETAAVMHTTNANVKVRLNRAKALLRKEVEKVYTPEDIFEFNLIYCNSIVDGVMASIYEIKNRSTIQ